MKAKKPINRSAIVVSAALTTVLLIGAALLTLDWRTTAAQESSTAPAALAVGESVLATGAPQAAPAQPALADDAIVAAYQAQLGESYRALQEAYAQIEALQAAQAQAPEAAAWRSDDDDDHEHDAHERQEHREDEREEHDDD